MKYPEANLLPVGPAVIVENKNGEADAQLYALKGTEEISCLGYIFLNILILVSFVR